MDIKDLKNKEKNELTNILSEMKAKMTKLRFELEANTLKDTSQIKKAKKDVARILTVLSQSKSRISKSLPTGRQANF